MRRKEGRGSAMSWLASYETNGGKYSVEKTRNRDVQLPTLLASLHATGELYRFVCVCVCVCVCVLLSA